MRAGGNGSDAIDTRLGRTVAIKVVSQRRQPDALDRKRLLREARTASALNHPNICTIYELEEGEDVSHLHCNGVSCWAHPRDLRRVHGLDAQNVIRYGIQIADALAYAHEHGIVHRDLKSDNVVVTADGHVKILDFGLAEHISTGGIEKATLSDCTLLDLPFAGTLAYMAPELLEGKAGDLRSDIWALGVGLYELAAGQQPFQGGHPKPSPWLSKEAEF